MTGAYVRWVAEDVAKPLIDVYRRTGADVPFGDPVPSHGCEMEGWFWRLTDSASGRVVVALCSVNQNPDGNWATVAVALHPGGIVRSAALDDAETELSRFTIHAGTDPSGRVAAGRDGLQIDLDDIHLNLRFADPFIWPKAFGGGGIFSSIPFLNQYWHPYRLGGKASGTVEFGGETWTFDGAQLYAERNWGAGFPERWWWGQAHDFDGADVSVAFSGGLLQLGPLRRDVTGVVVRLGRPRDPHDAAGAGAIAAQRRTLDRASSHAALPDRSGRRRHSPGPARLAGAAARGAAQCRYRLRAPCRSIALHRAQVRPGGIRRHLRAGGSRSRQSTAPHPDKPVNRLR